MTIDHMMADKTQHEFGMAYGHSPVAHRVVCVDFDGTIVKWGPLMQKHARGNKGAAKAIRAFKKAGYTVVIFTSRLSPTWHESSGEDMQTQANYVYETLKNLNIPYDYMTAEKIPAQFYIDDKAIEFKGDNWDEIAERVMSA